MVNPCLETPEIFRIICEQVEPVSSLAALARTCKTFRDPALDFLWSELQCLEPLLKCLPDDLRKEEASTLQGVSANVLTFRRPIIPSDWSRFMFYAPRIRKLNYSPMLNPRGSLFIVSNEVFRTLGLTAPCIGALLPNIIDLTWNPRVMDETFPYIRLFLGPHTTTISYQLHAGNTEILSLLPVLSKICPLLAVAKFLPKEPTFNSQDCGVLSLALLCWTNLRVLHIGNLNYQALKHISKLPTLRELHLTCLTKMEQPSTPLNPSCCFPSLTHISILTKTILASSQLFNFMSASPLQQISINVSFDHAPLSAWSALIECISMRCQKETLRNLKIWNEESDNSVRDPVDSAINVEPLLSFSNLSYLILGPTGGFLLPRETFSKMPRAWPLLKKLDLGMHKRSPGLSSITLPDLLPFAEHCPDLYYLGILLDARNITEYPSKPGRGFQNRKLQTLRIGLSPVEKPLLVAVFLSDIFPSLKRIRTTDGSPSGGYDILWREILRVTETMAAVREQERAHYLAVNASISNAPDRHLDSLQLDNDKVL